MTKLPDIIWCEVPAGEFIMGRGAEQHALNLPYNYYISKYHVTNSQYRLFVDAGGYNKRQYWTDAGWTEKLKPRWDSKRWMGPRDYGEPFNLSNHPVIGVSWYEAVAYCRWLTEVLRQQGKLAEGWLIRLPMEAEWEKVVWEMGGYSWGNERDPDKVNDNMSTVGCFDKGKSLCNCHDMAANIWEWGATKGSEPFPYQIEDKWTDAYLVGDSHRILHSNSWHFGIDLLSYSCRFDLNPNLNDYNISFRLFFVPIFDMATAQGFYPLNP